jgi:hypothetical protein
MERQKAGCKQVAGHSGTISDGNGDGKSMDGINSIVAAR